VIKRKRKLMQNVGGGLLNPPEHCGHKRQFPDGGVWAHLTCCVSDNICKDKCSLFRWFVKASEAERAQYLVANGVYYPCGSGVKKNEPEEKPAKYKRRRG